MLKLKKLRAALVFNVTIDHTGTHRSNVRQIRAFLDLAGYEVHVFPIQKQSDLTRLVKTLKEGEYNLVHCEQGHFLGLSLNGRSIFEELSVSVFSQIRDHWFYPWVWPNLKKAPETSTVFHTSEFILDIKDQLPGNHFHTLHTSQLNYGKVSDSDSSVAKSKIFYSGSCLDVETVLDDARRYNSQTLIDHVMDETEDAVEIPEWIWAFEFQDDETVLLDHESLDLKAFYKLFELARTRVRTNILNVLALRDATLFVKGGWSPPKNAKCLFFNTPISFEVSNSLSRQADYVFSDQATFRNEIGERVATALDLGQHVIARSTPYLLGQQNKATEKLHLYSSLDDLNATLEKSQQTKVEKHQITTQYQISNYVNKMIELS